MRSYLYILIVALSCIFCFSEAMGQASSNFGASRPQDSSITKAQLVLKAYATSLPNMYLKMSASGHVVLDTVSTGAQLIPGYGLVSNGDTISIDTALLNGAYVKYNDSTVTFVTPYQLAQAISVIPIVDTTSLSNRINQKLDTADFNRVIGYYINPTATMPNKFLGFGNSFTAGANASATDSAYFIMTAKHYGTQYANLAVPGTGIFWAGYLNGIANNPGHKNASLIYIGLNDYRLTTDAAKTTIKIRNGASFIAANIWNRAINSGFTGSGVVRAGTWSSISSLPFGGKTNTGALTTSINSSITYTFLDSSVTATVIGSNGTTTTFADYDLLLDGALYGSYSANNQTDAGINNYQPLTHIIRGLSYSSHTLEIVNKSADTLIVDYFGNLISTSEAINKPLYWFGIACVDNTNCSFNSGNNITDSFFASIAYGYPYQRINVSSRLTSAGIDIDGLHPNNLGMKQIFQAFKDSVKIDMLPRAAFTIISNGGMDLMRLGDTVQRRFRVDSIGTLFASSDNIVLSKQAVGYNYYPTDTNYLDRYLRPNEIAMKYIIKGDTAGLWFSSANSGSYGNATTWVRGYTFIPNVSSPLNSSLYLPRNVFVSNSGGPGALSVGVDNGNIDLYRSSSLGARIGTGYGSPGFNHTYIGSSSSAAFNAGGTFKPFIIAASGIANVAPQGIGLHTFTDTIKAKVHIGAGTAAANTAPLMFTEGPLLTTAQKGAWGYRNKSLFYVPDAQYRRFVFTDTVAPTSGQIPIGNSEGNYTNASLTGADGVSITNGSGNITVGLSQAGIIPTAVDFPATAITSNTTLSVTKVISVRYVDATSGNITITVSPSTIGQMIKIKRIDNSANTVTVQGATGQIDGAANTIIPPAATERPMLSLIYDGTNYAIY